MRVTVTMIGSVMVMFRVMITVAVEIYVPFIVTVTVRLDDRQRGYGYDDGVTVRLDVP